MSLSPSSTASLLAVFLFAAASIAPRPAVADHDRGVTVESEILDAVSKAREELSALDELVDAADSSAVRRELHRKAARVDELLVAIRSLTADGPRVARGETSGDRVSLNVGAAGFNTGVVVVVDEGRSEPVVVLESSAGDDPRACSESDFGDLLQAVQKESFSSGKLEILTDGSMDRWYTSDQVRRMLGKFSFDSDKVEGAVVMHPRTLDLENWFKVHDAFDFDSSKQELRKRVGR